MKKEIKIGIFVVAVLVIAFVTINYLRGVDIFDKEIEVSSRYENLEGLTASAPVFIKGYKAGKVASVTYRPETEDFEVVCAINRDFRIPEDSRMTIYSVDIMGGKGVKIDLGTSSVAAEDGAELAPAFEAGLMDGLSAGITTLLEKVTNTMDSLAVTVSGVNRLLCDANQAKISATLAHLEGTMADIRNVSSLVEGKSVELNAFIENLSSLSVKLGGIADKADSAIAGVDSIVSTVNEADIAGVVSSFKELLVNINDPDGTVGKLLVDGSVYDSVEELLNDVDSLVRKIEENPKKYIKISVF